MLHKKTSQLGFGANKSVEKKNIVDLTNFTIVASPRADC